MTKNSPSRSNTLIWILCGVLLLAGSAVAIHAILNFDKANVIVEWTTASELNTVGFYLLRGETSEGPFEPVNDELILATSDTLTGSSYSYEDPGVTAGTTYYYMLEEIENTGNSNQHGPITVQANSPAKIELLIGALLMGGAIIYAIILIRDRQERPQNPEIP